MALIIDINDNMIRPSNFETTLDVSNTLEPEYGCHNMVSNDTNFIVLLAFWGA